MSPEECLAKKFHDTYERLAPQFGYETRPESAKPWDEVPEKNRSLMIAVCRELLSTDLERKVRILHRALNQIEELSGDTVARKLAGDALNAAHLP